MKKISNTASIVLEEKKRLEEFIKLQEMKLNALSYSLHPDSFQVELTTARLEQGIENLESIRPYIEIAEMEVENANK